MKNLVQTDLSLIPESYSNYEWPLIWVLTMSTTVEKFMLDQNCISGTQ